MLYDDEFSEITRNKGHYAVQGHSRSHILVQIVFLFVINTNLRPIFAITVAFNPADGAVSYVISPEVVYR